MINYEQHQSALGPSPRHAAEVHPAVKLIEEDAATAEVRARWELGLARHQNAFAAFLHLEDIDANAPDLIDKFTEFYYATFPDLRTCADTFVDALGWQSTLDQLERNEPDLAGLLVWDYPAIESHIADTYDVVHYGGQVHLFHR